MKRSKNTNKNQVTFEIGTIVFTALAFFVWISIFSYRSTDPSAFTASTHAALNACGILGAYVSSFLLQVFGLGAFLIPVAFLFIAVLWQEEEKFGKALFALTGVCLSVISLTVFLSVHWKFWSWSETEFLTGGVLGSYLNRYLENYLNSTGASIFSLALFFGVLVITTPIRVGNFLSKVIRFATRAGLHYGRLIGAAALLVLAKLITTVSKKSSAAIQAKILEMKAAKARALEHQPSVPEGMTEASQIKQELHIAEEDEAVEVEEPEIIEEETFIKDLVVEQAQPKLQNAGATSVDFEIRTPDAEEKKQPAKKFKFETRKGKWKLPSLEFLRKATKEQVAYDPSVLAERKRTILAKMNEFSIEGEITAAGVGPVITLFEFKPGPGVKVAKIASMTDDLAMALETRSVRILAPLPGKNVVGIEIPSDKRQNVLFREFIETQEFQNADRKMPVVLGKDIAGKPVYSDLAKMPHLLVAGQTGSGKSVFMNGLICSLLYKFTPEDLRLILVDPKRVEFTFYADIPHLLLPVVDDPKSASSALKWAVREMERRYRILERSEVRNLSSYNEKVQALGAEVIADLLNEDETDQDWMEAFEKDEAGEPVIGKLPYIVIVIDELADLMMTAKKDVEASIMRISAKARAAGIHLVIATQRPSTNVITGVIKANMNSRISFALGSNVDSVTILDQGGAKQLLGSGDMLYRSLENDLIRIQGAYIDDKELEKITSYLRDQGEPVYRNEILEADDEADGVDSNGMEQKRDPFFDKALEIIRQQGQASTSLVQRRLGIGYPRAARIMEELEAAGFVGPGDGSKPRELLIP